MFIVHTAPFANKFAPTPCGQKLENGVSDDICSSFIPPLSRIRSLLRPAGRSLKTSLPRRALIVMRTFAFDSGRRP
ncbi:hypothetical protein CBI55_15670 [Pseudomonas syringae]|nr:hypothetical protein CBI55_15670 [Pseudomonas syringae]